MPRAWAVAGREASFPLGGSWRAAGSHLRAGEAVSATYMAPEGTARPTPTPERKRPARTAGMEETCSARPTREKESRKTRPERAREPRLG
jgi:hypothetical protein